MLPPNSFISNMYPQLGYSTDFQALQLIVIAVFGAKINQFPLC